jgi:hypothetical protein
MEGKDLVSNPRGRFPECFPYYHYYTFDYAQRLQNSDGGGRPAVRLG